MKTGTKEQAEGLYHKMTGKIREFPGEMGDISDLEAKGKAEKAADKIRKDPGDTGNV